MAIHSQRGKPSSTGGGGRVLLPPGPARWGPQEAEHKTAVVGEGDAAEAEGYPVLQGKTAGGISVPQAGGGENTP